MLDPNNVFTAFAIEDAVESPWATIKHRNGEALSKLLYIFKFNSKIERSTSSPRKSKVTSSSLMIFSVSR